MRGRKDAWEGEERGPSLSRGRWPESYLPRALTGGGAARLRLPSEPGTCASRSLGADGVERLV